MEKGVPDEFIDGTMLIQPNLPSRLKAVLFNSVSSWIDHRASSKGAALAFYALFSMTPILLLAIAIAGYFFGAKPARSEIASRLQSVLGEQTTAFVLALLEGAQDPVSGLLASLFATALLVMAATSVFAELKGGLDDLWGNAPFRQPVFIIYVRTRLLSFSLVLFLALLLLILIVASAGLAVVEGYADEVWGSSALFAAQTTASMLSFAITAGLFALIFKSLPDKPPSWLDALAGALFTALLFDLGKYLIGLYLSSSSAASSFGAAGSLVAMLLWIYYSAQIFFFGAAFTRQYALSFGSLRTPATAEPCAH